jgi:hypothetical protein
MRVLISLAASALLSVTASAANLTSFTTGSVSAIMQATGATNITSGKDGGVPFVDFDYKAVSFRASLRLCDEGTGNNCEGLLFAAAFESDASDSLDIVNGFNAGFPILTATKPDPKTLAFTRFVLATGGIQDVNVAGNFGLLSAAPAIYAEFRKSQVVAMNGVGGVALLSQPTGPAPAMTSVRLSSEQWTKVMTLVPSKAALKK